MSESVDGTTIREIINDSLNPIREGISKIETNISTMSKDIQEMKLNDALQKKDIDIMKEQIHAQEMTISALKDKLQQTENSLDKRIIELESKDITKKAKFVDNVTNGLFKKIGGFLLLVVVIGLCVILGIDLQKVQSLKM